MSDISLQTLQSNLKYLELLSRQYPTIASACTEIINLRSILNLPKGTEHFLTDIHGEYSAFTHVLKNASGVIKRKIEDIFGNTLRSSEKKRLATLIYYPELKLQHIKDSKEESNMNDFYRITLYRLLEICRNVSSKYTRSKVRKALPPDFAYIIEELLHEHENTKDKHEYYNEIINTIISIDRADEFITAICELIQRLVVDRLHILGDIYDRGPGPHIIIDELMSHHCVDIQWGNHDIVWMGAAAGSDACIANVIRICTRYANLKILEEGYGINMLPLATFAMETYGNDACACFKPKMSSEEKYRGKELQMISQMHKAISIIQFKIEGNIIKRRPDFNMSNRLLLDKIDYSNGTITIENKTYDLLDTNFPTIDPKDPYKLSEEENELMNRMISFFRNSEKLQKQAAFLYAKGSLYLNVNSNLLYHGCIPLNEDGTFKEVKIDGQWYKGKTLLDKCDVIARRAFFIEEDVTATKDDIQAALDGIWYLWCGEDSPLFGKDKMATFERYFIKEKETHFELKNPYFTLRNEEQVCNMILEEFNLNPCTSHIINGHVPVKTTKGENPIKAGGKLLVIDGGFSKSYQPETGIAGYTLIYNSYGLILVSHQPFESIEKAITEEQDILSSTRIVESNIERKRVSNTDIGEELKHQIEDLKMLLLAYRKGLIKQST
ncbi:fructose-1,6-bisphosphatase-3 [Hathewaya proteolytica DSM 3090]|uniref:Fructose-1,6-bisphosphatase class 3 n=1 Tax=Hathewaya proteolytica DSM 3090 TaxID=1121331 RepID=A0A1M6R2U0_9CLOT|nr:fructose-1,6-bisphosphatase [Hathewaya proteolytica]SHK26657.1 fructose-1,6-bisphosphatase-3 [Hathewaya proteolytica DSM 3090]